MAGQVGPMEYSVLIARRSTPTTEGPNAVDYQVWVRDGAQVSAEIYQGSSVQPTLSRYLTSISPDGWTVSGLTFNPGSGECIVLLSMVAP